jgi:hypothetical protein
MATLSCLGRVVGRTWLGTRRCRSSARGCGSRKLGSLCPKDLSQAGVLATGRFPQKDGRGLGLGWVRTVILDLIEDTDRKACMYAHIEAQYNGFNIHLQSNALPLGRSC